MADHGSTASFFASLFDFSFTSFVTTKLAKVVYAITVIVLGVVALFIAVNPLFGDNTEASDLIVSLVLATGFFVITVVYSRVLWELVIVLFRLLEVSSESLAAQVEIGRLLAGAGGAEVGPSMVAVPDPPDVAASVSSPVGSVAHDDEEAAPSSPPVVVSDDTEVAPAAVFCTNCGSEVIGDKKFCTSCGQSVGT